MAREGECCGMLAARPRVCSTGIFERVPVSIQPFLSSLAARYRARQSPLASDQTWSVWQEGSVTLISRVESTCL